MENLTLHVKNLNFSYDRQTVLENINFEYNTQDFLTIIGPNGGGKSTLLKLLLGLLKSKNGEILINNQNILTCKNYFGYVPQDTSINKNFPIDVLDVVLMGKLAKRSFGRYSKEDKIDALNALKQVNMQEFAQRKIGNLSGGQRQRVFIARALACNAKILILDEPTASIDIKGQIQIYDLLKELNKTKGVIIVSHDINVSIAYATKIAHVNKTLYMHDAKKSTKEAFLRSLHNHDSHFCSFEMLTTNTCVHNNMKWYKQ